jgi:hypothetical protein
MQVRNPEKREKNKKNIFLTFPKTTPTYSVGYFNLFPSGFKTLDEQLRY